MACPPPEGEFTYLQFHIDEIAYNLDTTPTDRPISLESSAGLTDSLVESLSDRSGT